MTTTRLVGVLLTLSSAMMLAGACGRADRSTPEAASATSARKPAASTDKYPAPRWPSYFRPTGSVDDLLPAARVFVRNRSGLQGKGMGILEAGESVLIVANRNSDPTVLDAVRRALVERKVTPHIKYGYELQGLTREEAERRQNPNRGRNNPMEAGTYEATSWLTGQFPDPEPPKAWLKQRRPDVYAKLFPEEVDGKTLSEADQKTLNTQRQRSGQLGEAIKTYLKAHPEIRGVFWGGGGSTGLRRQLYPMQDKFLGTFITDNIYNLESQMASYPGDVWQLAEEQLLEPISYAAGLKITDPEGTDLHVDLTEDMADRWAQGAYQRGHLYMFPNQATGRFGYSFVDYPTFNGRWLPREPIARIEGILAGTQGTGGFFPERWEVHFKNGFIADVKGGGATGATLREFLQYAALNELTYPYHKTPGYWYLYEIAFGSHPKAFRHPLPMLDNGGTGAERVRSGVIHWGLGIRLWHDPDAPTESKVWADFTVKHNVPRDHGWHTQTYFTTYSVKLRNADKWVNLLDKGHMTSLDDPEVRALASRYGDPDYLLAEDWIPEVPGINAPGDYMKDYAPHPGAFAFGVLDKAMKGTYAHYFPPPGTKMSISPSAPQAKPAATER